MAKKTKISRYNYIHKTKYGITIGVKGEAQRKITYKHIKSEISKVNKRLKEYSNKYYGKNDDFPRDIGMDSNRNKFTKDVIDFLNTALNDKNIKDIPVDIFNKYQKISNMAKDAKYFKEEFYGAVAKSYGYEEYIVEGVRKILNKGGFQITTEMGEFYDYKNASVKLSSDADRIIYWLVDDSKYLKKIKGAFDIINDNIKNVNYMRRVVQDYVVTGKIDEHILKLVKGEDVSNTENNSNK